MQSPPLRFTALVVLAVSAYSGVLSSASQGNREYAIKAAFVYNVLKFVEWPATSAAHGQLHVLLVTSGDLPEFAATLTGKNVQGRGVVVQSIKSLDALGTPAPSVVFIAADAASQLRKALKAAEGQPVLTIAEQDGDIANQAVIAMAITHTKLAFEVNLEAAARAGLRLNSNLLALAKKVRGAPAPAK